MAQSSPVPPWLRTAFRLPQALYAHHLGWLLGHRFVQLDHTGRRTGRLHRTVLEVLRYDAARGEAVVMSGFGPGADWLRNLQATPHVHVHLGRLHYPAGYRILPLQEAEAVLAEYEHRNRLIRPVLRLVLSWLLGWRYDATPAARRRAVEHLPMVALSAEAPQHRRPGDRLGGPEDRLGGLEDRLDSPPG